MKTAHIVVTVIETEDGMDSHGNISYSGGGDLTSEWGKNTFSGLVDKIDELLREGLPEAIIDDPKFFG